MDTVKDPILQVLIDHAKDLQNEVGGRLPVEVWGWVTLEPSGAHRIITKAVIGHTGNSLADAYSPDFHETKALTLDRWRKAGAPTSMRGLELALLEKEAERLGYTITPKGKVA